MSKGKGKGEPRKGSRKPGSLIAAGTIQAPSHLRWRDRESAQPTGTTLNWRRASSRVNGL